MRAYPVLDDGASQPSDEELRAHCRARLAAYEVPSEFVPLDAFPRNASAKVLKRELRAVAALPG